MSGIALEWAVNQDLPGAELIVLCAIASFHSQQEPRPYPSRESLAKVAGVSVKHVGRTIPKLEERGLIQVKHSSGRTSNRYALQFKQGHRVLVNKDTESLLTTTTGTHSPPTGTHSPPNRDSQSYEQGFEQGYEQDIAQNAFAPFWKGYPKKKDKKKAKAAWKKLKLDDNPDLANRIIQDVTRRVLEDRQWQDHQFIPYPASYLNGERWEDDIEPVKTRGGEKDDIYTKAPPAAGHYANS